MHNSMNSYNMKDLTWSVFLTLTLFAALMLLPEMALAASNPIEGTLCRVAKWLTGTTGRAIATIAIVIVGIGALMGKVSWGMAIIVVLGVAIVFGAPKIVEVIAGGETTCVDADAISTL